MAQKTLISICCSSPAPAATILSLLLNLAEESHSTPESKRVQQLQRAYNIMDLDQKRGMLTFIATNMAVNRQLAHDSIRNWDQSEPISLSAIDKIRDALCTKYEDLFRAIVRENGLSLLLTLRSDLLDFLETRSSNERTPRIVEANDEALVCLDLSLKRMLSSWFSVGFLEVDYSYRFSKQNSCVCYYFTVYWLILST